MPLRETIQEHLVRLGVEAGKVPADMKRFETVVTKHLKRTEKPLERQRKAFDKLGKAIKSLAAIWAGSKIVNEIKGLVTVVTDADDRIGKLSNRLGVAVRDLSAFTTGARLAGIGTTAAATGLQRFLRRTAQFRTTGKGEAADTVTRLGGAFESLVRQNAPVLEQLEALSKGISGVSDEGERLRLLFTLFDTEGVDLVRILNQGADGFRRVIEEGRMFGEVTAGQAKAAEEFNTSILKLKLSFQQLVREMRVAEGATGTANFLTQQIRDFKFAAKLLAQSRELQRLAGLPFIFTPKGEKMAQDFFGGPQSAPPEPQARGPSLPCDSDFVGPPEIAFPKLDMSAFNDALSSSLESVKNFSTDVQEGFSDAAQAATEGVQELNTPLMTWVESLRVTLHDFLNLVDSTIRNFAAGIGDAVGAALFRAADLETGLLQVITAVGERLVSALVALALQQLAFLGASIATLSKRTSAEMASWSAIVYAAAFAASAALGLPGVIAAPTVASAAVTELLLGSGIAAASGKSFGAVVPTAAEGKVFTGPTLAVVGDNPGPHPEVALPVDKLLDSISGRPVALTVQMGDRMLRTLVRGFPAAVRMTGAPI
mgnify:CR=1 FL=1